jgi:hypothetical protein
MLAEILRGRFGDDPRIDDLATHLAQLPDRQALRTATNAVSLTDLADTPTSE